MAVAITMGGAVRGAMTVVMGGTVTVTVVVGGAMIVAMGGTMAEEGLWPWEGL